MRRPWRSSTLYHLLQFSARCMSAGRTGVSRGRILAAYHARISASRSFDQPGIACHCAMVGKGSDVPASLCARSPRHDRPAPWRLQPSRHQKAFRRASPSRTDRSRTCASVSPALGRIRDRLTGSAAATPVLPTSAALAVQHRGRTDAHREPSKLSSRRSAADRSTAPSCRQCRATTRPLLQGARSTDTSRE